MFATPLTYSIIDILPVYFHPYLAFLLPYSAASFFVTIFIPSLRVSVSCVCSIIGLYASVVLVIGGFVRNYVSDLPRRLLVDGIINPNPLLELCDDINVARDARNFILEEILVGKLFAVFRSPEKLLALTEERENN